MEEKTLLINSLKVNYKIAGSGPAILILHGWGSSSSSWAEVLGKIAAQGFKVICPDLPGFGKSEAPLEAWTVSDYKKWLVEFIKSQNMDWFFLLGHSFGGRVAIKFSVDFPERIESLILCSSAGIKRELDLKQKIIYQSAKIGNAIFSPKIFLKFKDKLKNLFYIFLRNSDYGKVKGIMRKTIKKVLAEDLLPYLQNIKVRTLIIWGEKDSQVPLKDAHIFNEKIKNSKLEVLPNVGHSPHLEASERLVNIILRFIREQL